MASGDALPVGLCGGGPTGMATALSLVRAKVPVVIFEAGHAIADDPRAATFHPPTLEILARLGVSNALHARGLVAPTWQFRDRNTGLVAEFDLGVLADETDFPYRLQCEQHKLVAILRQALTDAGAGDALKFDTVVDRVTQGADRVDVHLVGHDEPVACSYVVGADGGRSSVRKSQDIAFEGFTYPEQFLVITTDLDYARMGYAYANYISDPEEWVAVFKVPGETPAGHWRTVFPMSVDSDEDLALDFDYAHAKIRAFVSQDTDFRVLHTNIYKVHQRVAAQFHKDRVLLAGDAAHVNNPLGGMGMNFGLQDAAELGEALAACMHEGDPQFYLARYARRRSYAARTFLQRMSIANKEFLEEKDADAVRRQQAEMRAIAADPQKAREHLMKTTMIEGWRKSRALD